MARSTLGRRLSTRRVLVAAVVVLAFGSVRAQDLRQQSSLDLRWQAWFGCWTPTALATSIVRPAQQVCVVPAQGTSAVDVVTLVGSEILSREHIEVNGERRRTETDGCAGWESAEWSSDGRRVYLKSEASCPNGVTRSSSGLFAISSKGDWLHVVCVTVGAGTGVRVMDRRPSIFIATPPEISSVLQTVARQSPSSARVTASASVSTTEIIEASQHVSAPVVEEWLGSSGQAFTIDARRLVKLADAGVPGRVINMVVALSYPQAFSIKPSAASLGALAVGSVGLTDTELFDTASVAALAACGPYGYSVSAYGWGPCSPYGSLFGYSFDRFGSSPYANAPWSGWYVGSQPLVITPAPSGSGETSHGQVVNGRGYVAGSGTTSGTSGASGTATPSEGPNTTSSSGSGSSSGDSNSGRPSGSGSGGERTAKPR